MFRPIFPAAIAALTTSLAGLDTIVRALVSAGPILVTSDTESGVSVPTAAFWEASDTESGVSVPVTVISGEADVDKSSTCPCRKRFRELNS